MKPDFTGTWKFNPGKSRLQIPIPDSAIFVIAEEQCDYLAKIMTAEEIQIVRKFRQVTEEAKAQIVGYVDYTFASKGKK